MTGANDRNIDGRIGDGPRDRELRQSDLVGGGVGHQRDGAQVEALAAGGVERLARAGVAEDQDVVALLRVQPADLDGWYAGRTS